MEFLKRCWAEIDLDAVKYNAQEFAKLLPQDTQTMFVVKASCYGHEDRIIAPFLQKELGARWFAVSNLVEAIRLRELGITGEILILGYTPPKQAQELAAHDLIQACTDLAYGVRLSNRGSNVRVHCAVDTGMTRIGCHGEVSAIADDIEQISHLDGIRLEGIFTHYSCADGTEEEDRRYTQAQTDKFFAVADELERRGVKLSQKHCLNSAGGAYGCSDRSTLARLGIVLYGLYPNPEKPLPFKPRPVMTLRSVVSQVKEIGPGESVSYGRTFVSRETMRLATVTVGYADGYPRALSNKGEVIIHGKRCPIVGRVCMDQLMADVSAVEGVKPGDEVTLMDKDLTADKLAALVGTIGYEVTCGISARVPRVEVRGQR